MSIESRINAIKAKQVELTQVENQYETVKEFVSKLWDQYFPAAEQKKSLNEKRKQLKSELKKMVESDKELAALLNSIK